MRRPVDGLPEAVGKAKQPAELLAPLCRMARDDVLDALARCGDTMCTLAADWRCYLFPEASDAVLADAYAQTVVFALLLARALEMLTDSRLTDDIGTSRGLLQRVILAHGLLTVDRLGPVPEHFRKPPAVNAAQAAWDV